MIKPFTPTLTGPDSVTSVTVAPQPEQSPSTIEPAYAVDPSTGFPVDVIKTGECPGSAFPDRLPQPQETNVEQVPPQDKYPTIGSPSTKEA